MPNAVLVEHAVRVVHPAVQRCVVVGGAVFLAVGRVEGVAQGQAVPAGILLGFAHGGAALVADDVEHHFLATIRGEVKGHGIVDLVRGKPGHEARCLLAVHDDVHRGFGPIVLDGEQQVLAFAGNAYEGVVRAEELHFHILPLLSLHRGRGKAAQSGGQTEYA